MPLEQLKLDDLTWAEMVAGIRRRIPAASDGRWTLHAPVDPGVTLLDLFAYLLEQRAYWLDQTPDALVHALLGLAGFERRPARPAVTVFGFPPRPFEVVPAGTQFSLAGSAPPLVFSTSEEAVLLPLEETRPGRYRVGLHAAGVERTADLEEGRAVCLFPAGDGPAEVRVVLWSHRDLGIVAGLKLSLLFDLEADGSISPHWSHEAVPDVPPPAEVRWLFRRAGQATPAPLPPSAVEDGTGGLRRSGIVRLTMPADWESDSNDANDPWPRPYTLWLSVERTTFSAPPRLRRLVPNVSTARHQRAAEHDLDVKAFDWIPTLPGQFLPLADIPVGAIESDFPPLEETVKLSIFERDGQWHEWERRQSLAFAGPEDRFFTVDRETGSVRFGDGLTGRLPVADTKAGVNLKLRYDVGGGPAGNLGAERKWEQVGSAGLTATNLVTADGGEETEKLTAARERAAAELRRVKRAVTGPDHETVVLATPGVAFARARHALGHHPLYPCRVVPGAVTVYVVPDVPRAEEDGPELDACAFVAAPVPDPGALAAARARLDAARLVASEVFVFSARYREVALAVEVSGDPADPSALRERVTQHLGRFLDPLRGGDERKGWPFGEPLRPSALLREAQRAVGEDGTVDAVSIGLDGDPPGESCNDVKIGEYELVVLANVSIRLRRTAGGQRGLR